MKIIRSFAYASLFATLASTASAAVIFKFGNDGANPDFITNSETGLTDAKTGATGTFSTTAGTGSAGVSFDITLTPNIRTISAQNSGVGVAGGSAGGGLDNDNAGAMFQEDIVVTISNFSGLAVGETLVITDLTTRFGNNGGETYTINGGTDQAFGAASNFAIDLPDAASFTIGAGAPATANTRFVIGEITVAVIPIPEPSAALLGGLGALVMLRRRRM